MGRTTQTTDQGDGVTVTTRSGAWVPVYVYEPGADRFRGLRADSVHLLRVGRFARLTPDQDPINLRLVRGTGELLCRAVEIDTSREPTRPEYRRCLCAQCKALAVVYGIAWPPLDTDPAPGPRSAG